MRLSTKGRYGTRLMLHLAINYGGKPVLLSEVAKQQEVSLKYLEQLVRPLKIAGLVKAERGFRGGYMLSRHPSKITLAQIIKALEGEVNIVECVSSGGCKRIDFCVTRDIWKELADKMADFLNNITLQEMVERSHKKEDKKGKVLMYNI